MSKRNKKRDYKFLLNFLAVVVFLSGTGFFLLFAYNLFVSEKPATSTPVGGTSELSDKKKEEVINLNLVAGNTEFASLKENIPLTEKDFNVGRSDPFAPLAEETAEEVVVEETIAPAEEIAGSED